jgi:serine/threonine-protein kinase
MRELSRRRFVIGTGAAAATGALAGCSGNGGGNGGNGNGNGGNGGNGNGGGSGPVGKVNTYLSDNEANLYEGSLEDHTGESEVTINVGAGDNGFSFSPSGIQVDTGTKIIWEWTGEGGGHNVQPNGDTDFEGFGTEEIVSEAGHTVEATFEESGAALYVCIPHQAQGMFGGIAVTE